MKLNTLLEMPNLKIGDRKTDEPRLCKSYNTPDDVEWITARSDGNKLDTDLEIFSFHNAIFCGDKSNNKIISILDAPRTHIIEKYFKGKVVHEESIDTCKKYKRKGITANFYYSIIKSKLSILSDYEHYTGTKYLWQSLSKKKGINIQIYKNHELIETKYDLIKDELQVWSSPQYLILATLDSLVESLDFVNI